MIMTLTEYDFSIMFNRIRPNHFSYEALGRLFAYYEEVDEHTEFDPVAICCEWSEVNIGSEEHLNAVEDGALTIELENGNVLVQEY